MDHFRIFTIILIIPFIKEVVKGDLNYTSLMREFLLLCGPEYFCLESSKTYKWKIETSHSFQNLSLCPECKCDHACLRRGDCCPDLFFSFPRMDCVDRTVIDATYDQERNEQAFALMVTHCSRDADPDMASKCTNLTDTKSRLLNSHVVATGFPVSFYNIHCAKCNNVREFKPWTLDIHCRELADFNYLSTVEDVISMAYERNCIFQYFKFNENGIEEKEENCFDISENGILYTKCNQTGEWAQYDPDIQYACESTYKRKFRIFKNVFCYMCNPSGRSHFNRIVENCNETGQWKNMDMSLQEGCTNLPFSLNTLPYKNIFCYLCNTEMDGSRPFVDIVGSVTETVFEGSSRFHYRVSILKFDLTFFKFTVEQLISENSYLDKFVPIPFSRTSFINKHGTLINLTSLLAYKAAIDGGVSFCNGRNFYSQQNNGMCSCDLKCVLPFNPPCCSDLAVEIPATCISFQVSKTFNITQDDKNYLVFDGCLGETRYLLFEKGCREQRNKSIFTFLPVTEEDGISYKNLFCALCNLYKHQYMQKLKDTSGSEESIEDGSYDLNAYLEKYAGQAKKYEILQLELKCVNYLDYSHFLIAGNLINLASKMNCKIQYKTTINFSNVCNKLIPEDKCSSLQTWTNVNDDIKWACDEAVVNPQYSPEHWTTRNIDPNIFIDKSPEKTYSSSVYRNVYCALCRPVKDFTTYFIDECPLNTSNVNCKTLPRIYKYYLFKNKACANCHGVDWHRGYPGTSGIDPEPPHPPITGMTWYPVLRNLFSFTQHEETVGSTNSYTLNCTENEVFDKVKNICRKIRCYEGKYLRNSECIPLFPTTKNLRYFVEIRTEVLYSRNKSKQEIFDTTTSIISQKVIDTLQFDRGHITSKIYARPSNCNNDSELCILPIDCNMEIFIRSSIQRYEAELTLLQLSYNKLVGSKSGISILTSELLSYFDDENVVQDLKSHREVGDDKGEKRLPVYSSSSFFFSMLSEVLLCRQIELHSDEFRVFKNKTLFLSRKNIEIGYNKYSLSPMGTIRICYEYLEQLEYFPSNKFNKVGNINAAFSSSNNKILWIVSIICTVLSIISICVGLIFYCLLPHLRTNSGKLIMVMMVSLLFTLIFFQLSSLMIYSRTSCVCIGAILHFSWLSVFFSMNVCNYRTFIVFVSKALKTPTSKTKAVSKELVQAVAYIFALPLLCVISNILIASFSKGYFALGYGGTYCFIDTLLSNILTFITPVLMVLISNVVFFILTVRAIRKAPNVRSNQEQRNEFAIYLRLTSITGMAWLLQILDFIMPFTAFSYVATSVVLLQGLFVFLAFFAKRRNFYLLHQLWKSNKDGIESSNEIEMSKRTQSSDAITKIN